MRSRIRIAAMLFGLLAAGPAAALDPAQLPTSISTPSPPSAISTVFTRKDVPEDVRRAALRRLWVPMRLPVSCDELCGKTDLAASGFALLTSEKQLAAAQ